MPEIALPTRSHDASWSPCNPSRVALVGRSQETIRAVDAYLRDAGVASLRLADVQLEQLLVIDAQAVVIFVEGFALSDLLPLLKALHSQRPGLALVFVAGHAGRFALWRAF